MARRKIGLDELDNFELGDEGQLYWSGKAVVLEKRLTLRGAELAVALFAAVGAFLAGVHPFLKSFNWIN